MANEARKDFNAMLHDAKDMPRLQIVTDPKTIEKYGGSRMYFAPPLDYDRAMRRIPFGRLTTVGDIRAHFAAWASSQRQEDETPWWRTLKAGGELNPKYPGGIEAQRARLEAEGHTIVQRGRKNLRYFVADYTASLFPLD